MKHLNRFESTSTKTIRHREYRHLYQDYFHELLRGFNDNSINNIREILGNFNDTYDDLIYDVDYLEKVKKYFEETKKDFDELSQMLKDLQDEYDIESSIYTIKPYGKYKQEVSHGSESFPAFRTNPVKIKTNLDTEDAIFDVYIGLSNGMEGTGLYQSIKSDVFKGISEFSKILENKGSIVEMTLFTGSVSNSGKEMKYKSFINLKFNYKY